MCYQHLLHEVDCLYVAVVIGAALAIIEAGRKSERWCAIVARKSQMVFVFNLHHCTQNVLTIACEPSMANTRSACAHSEHAGGNADGAFAVGNRSLAVVVPIRTLKPIHTSFIILIAAFFP